MAAPMLPGSGPFKKLALSALEANNLYRMRDVKVRHGDDWDDMPADLRATEASRILSTFGAGAEGGTATMDSETQAEVAKEASRILSTFGAGAEGGTATM